MRNKAATFAFLCVVAVGTLVGGWVAVKVSSNESLSFLCFGLGILAGLTFGLALWQWSDIEEQDSEPSSDTDSP